MKYCVHCASPLSLRIPDLDDRERHICDVCGHIHYLNPRLIVCAIPAWEDRVLLCRRAIEPRHGLWTLPGGFMENGETAQQGAARETLEEACARIEVGELFAMFNVTHIDQVHLFFLGTLLSPDFSPGAESLETGLFAEHEVPWNEIAFPAVKATLRQYFEDRAAGVFRLRLADVVLGDDNTRRIKPLNY